MLFRSMTSYHEHNKVVKGEVLVQKLLAGESIALFNDGKLQRDFTYIDDILAGILAALERPAASDPSWAQHVQASTSPAPYKIYNLGNNKSVELLYFIKVLEDSLGRKAKIEYLPMQAGDVYATYADIDAAECDLGFKPVTDIETGLPRFVEWYKSFH